MGQAACARDCRETQTCWRDIKKLVPRDWGGALEVAPVFDLEIIIIPMPTVAVESHGSIALGITVGLVASFVQSLGLTIQRKSHVLNQLLPEHRQRVEHRRP